MMEHRLVFFHINGIPLQVKDILECHCWNLWYLHIICYFTLCSRAMQEIFFNSYKIYWILHNAFFSFWSSMFKYRDVPPTPHTHTHWAFKMVTAVWIPSVVELSPTGPPPQTQASRWLWGWRHWNNPSKSEQSVTLYFETSTTTLFWQWQATSSPSLWVDQLTQTIFGQF